MSKMMLTQYGLVNEGIWDKVKQVGQKVGRALNPINTQTQFPFSSKQKQPHQGLQKSQAAEKLAKQLGVDTTKLMQMIQSGNIPNVSPETVKQLQTFFIVKPQVQQPPAATPAQQPTKAPPGSVPPVIGGTQSGQPQTIKPTAQTQHAASPKTNYGASPTSPKTQKSGGDEYHTVSGRIPTTDPQLRMVPQQSLKMTPQQPLPGLRMALQQPLPGQTQQPQMATQQPMATEPQQQTQPLKMVKQPPMRVNLPQKAPQQSAVPVAQQRSPTPQGLAALRGQAKWYPKGNVGKYKLEETLTEEQLKTIVKEVVKEIKSQQDEGKLKSLAAAGLLGWAGLQHPDGQQALSKIKQTLGTITQPGHMNYPPAKASGFPLKQ